LDFSAARLFGRLFFCRRDGIVETKFPARVGPNRRDLNQPQRNQSGSAFEHVDNSMTAALSGNVGLGAGGPTISNKRGFSAGISTR
jgi:hypothetical protein